MIRAVGNYSLSAVGSLGQCVIFALRALGSNFHGGFSLSRFLLHLFEIGVRTTPLVLLIGLFTGMVIGLNGYYVLVDYGSESLLGTFVANSIIQEIGPVLTAVMVVGQAGSALAAEIGSQRNREQIDALEVMGIQPLAFLVAPRLLAAIVAFPILTAFFNLVGIFGGHLTGVELQGLDAGVYEQSVLSGVSPGDVWGSLFKGATFGLLTMTVCCFEGYYTHERSTLSGERAVSQSATRAVVTSSVLILASNYLISSFLLAA